MLEVLDMLVRPLGAYGAHVWGPSMFQTFLHDPLDVDNAVEKVHSSSLKLLAGGWVGRVCT